MVDVSEILNITGNILITKIIMAIIIISIFVLANKFSRENKFAIFFIILHFLFCYLVFFPI